MKVILAGLPKTGTKSMAMALRQLGYTVYDVTENLTHLGDEWLRIMNDGGGSVEDMRRMYENVDATCDVPACHYWEELYNAFPQAKVAASFFPVYSKICLQKELRVFQGIAGGFS